MGEANQPNKFHKNKKCQENQNMTRGHLYTLFIFGNLDIIQITSQIKD